MIKEAAELIKKSKRIGIILPDAISGDSLGSAFALLEMLRYAGREAKLFFSGPIPRQYAFLTPPDYEAVSGKTGDLAATNSNAQKDFIISINTVKHPIKEARYEKENGTFSIIISPKDKNITKDDLEFYSGALPHDLFIAVNVASPDELSNSFDKHLEEFSKKPVITITPSGADEFFGDVNIVNGNRAALAESVYMLAKELALTITERAASWILLGIIEKTNDPSLAESDSKVTATISALVGCGANRNFITQHLFPQKKNNEETSPASQKEKAAPLNLLQLWGRALVRSRYDEVQRIVWSFIPREDFEKTRSSSGDIVFLAQKTAEHIPAARLGIFLLENPHKNHIRAVVDARDKTLETKLIQRLGDALEQKQGLLVFKNAFAGFIEAENYLLELFTAVL